jgi:hypothetical protein
MSDSGRRSWRSKQVSGSASESGDKPTRSLPRGLVPPPTHGGAAVITNGQPTLPLRVKIVTWGRASRDCGEQAVTWSVGSRRNNHSRPCEAFASRVRTHLALGKDAPLVRSVQQFGFIAARPILGGLHHEYCRT